MLCVVNRFSWSANEDTLLCTFAIIEVGIPYNCSLDRFCTFVFRSSSLGLIKEELAMLVVEGTQVVNRGTKVPIFGRVAGADVETIEGVVIPISVEIDISIAALTWVCTFKSPKGEVACIDYACEDDCEEDEQARAIDLLPLKCIHKQFVVLAMKLPENSNKILKTDLIIEMDFEKTF